MIFCSAAVKDSMTTSDLKVFRKSSSSAITSEVTPSARNISRDLTQRFATDTSAFSVSTRKDTVASASLIELMMIPFEDTGGIDDPSNP